MSSNLIRSIAIAITTGAITLGVLIFHNAQANESQAMAFQAETQQRTVAASTAWTELREASRLLRQTAKNSSLREENLRQCFGKADEYNRLVMISRQEGFDLGRFTRVNPLCYC